MDVQEGLVTAAESGSRLASRTTVEEATGPVTHGHGQGEEALKDVVCGSIAGVVGKYIEYPFDTVKVRLQSQPHHLPLQYTGPLDCFTKSLQQDGFRGIYRGISAPLVGAAVETSCLFFSVSICIPTSAIAQTKLISFTVPPCWRCRSMGRVLPSPDKPS
jgi:ornithine carrier protein